MGTTNTLDLNNRINELEKAVSGGDSAQANKTDIATEFSATTNYTAGCFVYYGGKLYQFNADHAAGAWDPTDVVTANVTDQIVSNKVAIEGLTSVEDEILVYHKRYNGGDLWPNDTLTFNNVPASSNIVYNFVAIDTTAAGAPESAYLIVKATGVQVYGKVGTFMTAYDSEHTTLTITLPSSSYWAYRLEIAARRNG